MLHRMAGEKIVVLHNINEYQEIIVKLKTQFNLGKKCARSGFTERDLINQGEKTMSYDTCKCSEKYTENFGRLYRAQFKEKNIFARLKQEKFSLIEKMEKESHSPSMGFPYLRHT